MIYLTQPTRRVAGQGHSLPIWFCFWWGLPRAVSQRSRVSSYLTISPLLPRMIRVKRCVSVALSVGSPRPSLHWAPCPLKSGLSSLTVSHQSHYPTHCVHQGTPTLGILFLIHEAKSEAVGCLQCALPSAKTAEKSFPPHNHKLRFQNFSCFPPSKTF